MSIGATNCLCPVDRGGCSSPLRGARLALLVLAACALFALEALPASAALTHPLLSSFDGNGSTAGAFSGVDRLALSQSSGNVFVLDSGNQVLDQFDAAGNAQAFSDLGLAGATGLSVGAFGGDPDVAVDSSGGVSDGNIYFSSEAQGKVYGFDSAGATLAGFPLSPSGDICGVGVDASGNVWVSDFSSGIHEYDSAGTALSGLFSGFAYCHFAFDSSGNLYAAQWNGQVEKYNPDGSGGFTADPTTPVLDAGSAKAVATDPASGHVYVVHSGSVSEYDSGGALVDTFGSGTLSSALGIAVDGASGNVYVSDSTGSGIIDIFGPAQATFTQIGQFGSPGSGPGQFVLFGPLGMAVDQATGDVYAGDTVDNRVERFDAGGVNFISQFGGSGTGDGQFQYVTGVAVGQSNGNTYTFDDLGARVEKFDSQGNFLAAWGWGVSDGNAQSEVCTSNCQAGISGAGAGQFAGGFFTMASVLAVDSSGDVYVADPENARVEKFDSQGNYLSQVTTNLSSPRSVALDGTGNLYVADPGSNAVQKFDSSGSFVASIAAGTSPGAVATDAAGDLFVYAKAPVTQILEYDPAGNQIDAFGSGALSSNFVNPGIAFDDHFGVLYVADPATNQVFIFGTQAVIAPSVTTGQASNVQSTSTTLGGTVNPNGVQLSDCHFDYGTDTSYGQTAACVPAPASLPPDSNDHAVSADLTGLQPNTTYHFRVSASNGQFLGTANAQDRTFTTPGPPAVDSESVANVTSTEALLKAQVNPDRRDTTYHFEYGTSTAYGTSVPVPDADIGSGSTDVAVSQQLTGLQPSTTYHFRVVAVNSVGTTDGPDHTLVTYPAAPSGLPDGRAYELVTPPDKNGQSVGPEDVIAAVAADGRHVFYYTTTQGTFGNSANGLLGEFLASRGSGGWQSTSVQVPASEHANGLLEYARVFDASADFSTLIDSTTRDLDPADQDGGIPDIYARGPGGAFAWISQNETADANSVVAATPLYLGSSADASHILFETFPADAGAEGPPTDGNRYRVLYEWAGGSTRLVGVDSDGSPTSACGAVAGGQNTEGHTDTPGTNGHTNDRAISSDGSRIFFESPDPEGEGDPSCSPEHGGTQPVELYLRQSATTTTEVSLSQKTGSVGTPAPTGATYRGASEDGSRVFFTSGDQLTDDPASSSGGLYVYDVDTGQLTFIATGTPLINSAVPAISADGSHVYFTGEAPGGPAGQPGLYLWNEGQISYISPAPVVDNSSRVPNAVSRDGSTLAFTSDRDLTSFEAHGKVEVYVYRASDGSLVCASCDPNGIAPTGDAALALRSVELSGSSRSNRSVTNDGSRVFFQSPNPLVPQDTNGLDDVYEYEHGALRLLSDGNGRYETVLVGASSDGNDVIVSTRDSLVPQDQDGGLGDLYDVRVGGGFPFTPPAPPCQGETCKGPPSTAPPPPSAASISFSGPGNGASAPRVGCGAKVKASKKTVTGATFALSVKLPGKGRISGTGRYIKSLRKSVAKAGTYKLKFGLTASAKRSLRRHKRLGVKVRIGYVPSVGKPCSATVSLTLKQPKKKGRVAKTRAARKTRVATTTRRASK